MTENPPWRHIPWAYPAAVAYPATGHHYTSRFNRAIQVDFRLMPHGTPADPAPRVEVHRLVNYGENEWECVFTAALVPGPARFCCVCGREAGADAITIKPRDTDRTVCGPCAQTVRLTTQEIAS